MLNNNTIFIKPEIINERNYVPKTRIKGQVACFLIRLLFNSLTVEKIGWENNLLARKGNRRVIYVLWHASHLMALACYRNHGIAVLTSRSRDGDIVATAMAGLGFDAIRGSSTRGGVRALMELSQHIKNGVDVALTVDGPLGPKHKAKSGAFFVAKRTGAALLPLGFAYSNVHRLNSWDRFEIPFPFSRVAAVTGDPIFLDEKISETDSALLIEKKIFECERLAAERISK
ncbi:MAG: lysophospholipid acyltransferase family protein [Candidatus Riflebacteria bacterium]|nr:lysophospholipid acyltransferase family protein [Candidatus Riflebacteria bacterium]